jgi:hypothetical protein
VVKLADINYADKREANYNVRGKFFAVRGFAVPVLCFCGAEERTRDQKVVMATHTESKEPKKILTIKRPACPRRWTKQNLSG